MFYLFSNRFCRSSRTFCIDVTLYVSQQDTATSCNRLGRADVLLVVAARFARRRCNRQVRALASSLYCSLQIPGVNLTAAGRPSILPYSFADGAGMPRISRQMSFPPTRTSTCREDDAETGAAWRCGAVSATADDCDVT